ncbi:MAG: PmoA family protein [Cyclobacteriaceae bacterium]
MISQSYNHYVCALLMGLAVCSCGQKASLETDGTETIEQSVATAKRLTITHDSIVKRAEVRIDGDLFTAYIYPKSIAKPVLFPIRTASGRTLTRAFPLESKPGERVDHPHHVGHWLNYGDVNGLDFWNNSQAIPEEKRGKYGTIYHSEIIEMSDGDEQGTLEVTARWTTPAATTLLNESTTFVFGFSGDTRSIERTTTLTATDHDVAFEDNKEGMIALRVTRAMELPTDKPAIFTDAQGNPTEVEAMNNEGVNGNYLSSEGLEGNDVWGTRAKWVMLYSQIEGDPVAIVILDHPDNVGYPTYWHARDYGLFSANPLGQKIFSDGKDELHFKLKAGESVTFKYKILVHSGSELSKDVLENEFNNFSKK